MRIIVTGFGGFLSNKTNPTKEVLNLLPKKVGVKEIYPIELPVVFDECFRYLKPFIDDIKPDVIIMLGLASGRRSITPERVAINMKNANGPDNKGYQPMDEVIVKGGKEAYFSTLPIRRIESVLKENEIPVSISNTAGLYVCNNIMYHVLSYIDCNNLDCRAGFIHVPNCDESKTTKDVFSLPIKDIYQSVININKKTLD